MKLTTRGFTLVELMIVIAIIGVLAAALFPAMSGYLARGRDTARISHVGQIITAASTYFSDFENYTAIVDTNGCVNSGALNTYMGGKTPTNVGTPTHCPTSGLYGAGIGTGATGGRMIAISAALENTGMGNSATGVTEYQGDLGEPTEDFALIGGFTKASGTGYVIAR